MLSVRILFAGALIACASAANNSVQVTVERPRLVVDRTGPPNLAGFTLVFDARFASQSDTPVEMPDRDGASVQTAGITQNGVESQQSDGSWRSLVNGGTLLWKGDTVFPDRKSLGAKETLELKGVSSRLVIYKSQLAELGVEPTLRLTLILSCKQRDGNVAVKSFVTSPFVLTMNAP